MKKILFTRDFKYPTGGHVTVRDYFIHSLNHPGLDPYLYFTPGSKYATDDTWQEIPQERIVKELAPENYDLFFVGGRDWLFLPAALENKKVIHTVQDFRFAQKAEFQAYLKRPAYRICNSQELYEAIARHITGVAVVISGGIDFELFNANEEKKPNSILIWGRKNVEFAARLFEELKKRGLAAQLLVDSLPRKEFAELLQRSDIFIPLLAKKEGAPRPPLEGMASRCVVICSDAEGNRSYCLDGQTCLLPRSESLEDYLAAIQQLADDSELKERIRHYGYKMSQRYTLAEQRRRYYDFLDEYLL